jgi:hypothetical protein
MTGIEARTDEGIGWRRHVEEWLRGQDGYAPFDLPGLPVDPPDEPPPPDVWADAFLTHTPLGQSPAVFAQTVRQRIANGECSGVMYYRSKDAGPLRPDAYQAALIASGPPCHVVLSPKVVTDRDGAAAWAAAWPEEWRSYVRVAYFQEPGGDFGGPDQPPLEEFVQGVTDLADACDPYGIASMLHLELWTLSPNNPKRDAETAEARAMVDACRSRIVAIGWSYFVYDLKDRSGVLIPPMVGFMADYSELAYGPTAVGVSVQYGIPQDDKRRTDRARLLAAVYAATAGTGATLGGCYALPQGPDKTHDFYDPQVAGTLTEVRKGRTPTKGR